MKIDTRASLILSILACATAGRAVSGAINLTTFPTVAVGDGRSTITVRAEVRDSQGRLVADGTQVLFEATLGRFRQDVVTTSNGVATAILVASSTPGRARLTARVIELNAVSSTAFDFVANKSLLSSAREYYEVTSKGQMVYSPTKRLIEASSKKGPVIVRYRDVQIEAEDLQLSILDGRVIAKNAKVKIGKETVEFEKLRYSLKEKSGTGVRTGVGPVPKAEVAFPWVRVVEEMQERPESYKIELTTATLESTPVVDAEYKYQDLSEELMLVTAKRIVAYPYRDIQFQNATVQYDGSTVMRMPLYQMSASGFQGNVTDQYVQFTGGRFAVNYPYYLSLKPGQTSNVRVRLGNLYGTGVGASGGAYVDYELRWNKGDEFDGGLDFRGIGRKDWTLGTRQFIQFDSRSSGTMQLDTTAGKSLNAAGNYGRQFDGFGFNYSGSYGRQLRGLPFRNQQHFASLEKDPTRIKPLKSNLYFGLTASASKFSSGGVASSQTSYGLRTRAQTDSFKLSKSSTISSDVSVSKLFGKNVARGFSTQSSTNFYSSLSNGLSMRLGYEFRDDRYYSSILDKHSLGAGTRYDAGKWNLGVAVTKGLDINRFFMNSDLSYRVSPLFRLAASTSVENFRSSKFTESTFILGYTLGIREVGLSYSTRTKRIGIEILGTSLP